MVIEGGNLVRSFPICLVLACGLSGASLAAEERLRLTWSAPPGCPSSDEVRRAASRNVGTGRAGDLPLEAEAHVEERPLDAAERRFRVVLRTRRGSATGERVIEASTCQGVAEATAVVLSLALVAAETPPVDGDDESSAAFDLETPERSRTEASGERPPSTTEDGPPRQPARAQHRGPTAAGSAPASDARLAGDRTSWALGVQVAAERGTLPSWAPGGSLVAAWVPGRARLEADVRRWAARSKNVEGSQAGARFQATSLGVRGCYAVSRAAVELSPCAGGDAHFVRARGFGADTNHDVDVRWIAVTAGLLGRTPLTSWLALRGRVEAVAPLTRPTFVVERVGAVHQSSSLGLAAFFGAEALIF